MMKKIQLLCGYLVLMGLLSACSDEFLEIVPDNYLTQDEFLQTPQDAQEILNSSYKALASGEFMGGNTWILAELMADNINGDPNVLTNGDFLAHYTWTTDIFLGTTRSLMHGGGKVYGRGNYLLDNLGQVEGLSEGEATRITAEVRFLRGIALFELVRMFAQPYGFTADNSHLGIPIWLSSGVQEVDQSTVAEVYEQVIADMQFAVDNLPEQNGGYADKMAARGYLAKVYFQMHDYQNAFDMANAVIESGRFSFSDNLVDRFSREGSPEAVFELISTDIADNAGGFTAGLYRVNPDNTAQIYLSDAAFAAATANPNDQRGVQWFEELTSGLVVSKKFDTDLRSWMQMPIVHLTELKLIRAECAGELNANLPVGVQDLNDIKQRAGLPLLSTGASALQLIQEARRERRIELVSEGNRLHEIKRIGAASRQGLTALPEGSIQVRRAPWDCPGMVCQFPDGELRGNPDLKPNPSGGCN